MDFISPNDLVYTQLLLVTPPFLSSSLFFHLFFSFSLSLSLVFTLLSKTTVSHHHDAVETIPSRLA